MPNPSELEREGEPTLADQIQAALDARPTDWRKVIGKWPGDETEEEVRRALEEMS